MSITLHCEYCGKKVEAPDKLAGKWGKCPSCHNKLYIPDLISGEELKLAPVDKKDEERKKQLMNETFQLSQDILLEREASTNANAPSEPVSQTSDKELTKNVIVYLRQIANGELNEAEKKLQFIARSGPRAISILDKIALSEIPEPELVDIPQQVLAGLIRDLRNRIT